MKFKILALLICLSLFAFSGGCKGENINSTTKTTENSSQSTAESSRDLTERTTSNSAEASDNTPISETTTSTTSTKVTSGQNANNIIFIGDMSVSGLPVIVGDSRNMIKISKAGTLNGDPENPMFILVTNIGEDDIYSASIKATSGGREIVFNVTYLTRGSSVWVESTDSYIHKDSQKIMFNSDAVFVTSGSAGVPIDSSPSGILEIYAGVKNGGRGIYIKNISGRDISRAVIKYRPLVDSAGLFSAPFEVTVDSFTAGNTVFKANSYIFDVMVSDVQVMY